MFYFECKNCKEYIGWDFSKHYKAECMNENKGQISDGYHTFDELYEHRNLLFIQICQLRAQASWIGDEEHFPGYFCLYTAFPQGQISYHIPNKYRHMVEALNTNLHRRHPKEKWDGHTSADVLERLRLRNEDVW